MPPRGSRRNFEPGRRGPEKQRASELVVAAFIISVVALAVLVLLLLAVGRPADVMNSSVPAQPLSAFPQISPSASPTPTAIPQHQATPSGTPPRTIQPTPAAQPSVTAPPPSPRSTPSPAEGTPPG